MTRRRTFVRAGHGQGKGTPHVEVPPADELPAPVPGEPVPLVRREDGTIADSTTARELGRLGGLARARRVRLVHSLGLSRLAEDSAFAPYRSAADEFVSHHLEELARSAGGTVGAAASTMIASAALQLAASRFAFDRFAESGDIAMAKLGSSMADASRQNLLAAYSHAVLEAEGRARSDDDHLYVKEGS